MALIYALIFNYLFGALWFAYLFRNGYFTVTPNTPLNKMVCCALWFIPAFFICRKILFKKNEGN